MITTRIPIRYCNGIIEPLAADEFAAFYDDLALGTHRTLDEAKQVIEQHVAMLLEQGRLDELLIVPHDSIEPEQVAWDCYHLGLVPSPFALMDQLYAVFKQRNPGYRPPSRRKKTTRKQRQDGRARGDRSSSWQSQHSMQRRTR